jgi:membrane-associated protein
VLHPMLLGMDWMDPQILLDWFGPWFFWISVLIVFIECGLLFPFLPGDTLLFAIGLFIATDRVDIIPGHHSIDLAAALAVFALFAFLGNVAGYEIGRRIGPPLYERNGRILKRKYFDQTEDFFEKHGSKALVLGRFVPFVRTFITVVAGVTHMDRRRFFLWSAVGAVLWVASILLLGFTLGQAFPGLGENIDKALLVILAFTVIPVGYEWWRHRRTASRRGHDADRDGTPDVDVAGLDTTGTRDV